MAVTTPRDGLTLGCFAAPIDDGSYRGYFLRMKVGTKTLKNRLSHYLRLVRAGERVQVTDNGTVVAEIRSMGPPATSDDACLRALEQDGLATMGQKRVPDFTPVARSGKKLLSRIVIEGRD